MKRVACFGELLLRLSPALGGEWLREAAMPVYIGGAELNVAQALAGWKVPVKYITAVPDHALSHEILEALAQKNIDTSGVQLSGNRIGAYYLPQGADLKSAGVIYDRAGSSFAELQPGTINWNEVLNGYQWFHFSAINPAINANVAAVCKEALEAARAKKMTISVDLNYRARLWQYGQQPVAVMQELLPYCDVIMGNIWAADTLAGIPAPIKDSTGYTKEQLAEAAGDSMQLLRERYPQVTTIAYTFRLQDEYFAVIQYERQQQVSRTFELKQVVDRAGSGDCFMAGLIYGFVTTFSLQEIINFAASAAVGKLSEKGDATRQTVEQIQARKK